MARFKLNPKFFAEIETRVARGLDVNSQRGKDITKPLTPVDTSYAQKSVHAYVTVNGRQVLGDTTDENGNAVPDYSPRDMPTAFVGSNTAPRPDQFSGGGGYFLGLERGVYSRKGSNMLAAAFSVMQDELLDDIRDAFR